MGPLRLIGDLTVFASSPVLIARILTRGTSGVSATTLGLHLIVCLTRYFETLAGLVFKTFGVGTAWPEAGTYVEVSRVGLVCASIAALVTFVYKSNRERGSGEKSFFTRKDRFLVVCKKTALYTIPSLILAYRVNYSEFSIFHKWSSRDTGGTFAWVELLGEYFSPEDLFKMGRSEWVEMLWAFSIFLGAVADLPQYKAYYRFLSGRTSMEWWLFVATALPSLSRLFYIPHWVLRYLSESMLDQISLTGGAIQLFIFWMFFILAFNKVNNAITEEAADYDMESQFAEFDGQWGVMVSFEQQPLMATLEPKDDEDEDFIPESPVDLV